MYYSNLIPGKWLISILILLMAHLAAAQPSLTETELKKISSSLIETLNGKRFDGKILVWGFTDLQGRETKLGTYLAGVFRNHLVNAPSQFKIVEREDLVVDKKPFDLFKILGEAGEVLQEEDDIYKNQKDAKTGAAVGQGIEILADAQGTSPGRKTKINLKGVDALIKGTITTMGDDYFLDVKVRKKKGDVLIATASGLISLTTNLTSLHQSTMPAEKRGINSTTGTTPMRQPRAPSPNHSFKKLHLKFELIECIENGRYVECKLRITSEGKDTQIQFYKPRIRIFNQDNGKEYEPVSINISDVTDSWNVRKVLIRNTPVTSVITFEPGERIDVISRLAIGCYSDPTQWFDIDISDIFVQ